MSVMLGNLYTALLEAKVPADKAQKAAEEVAGYESTISKIDNRMTKVEAGIDTVKWMIGVNMTLTLAIFLKLFWPA